MANHITILRKKAGFNTAREAAESLDISNSMMYQLEGGYKKPGSKLAFEMSNKFNCSMEDIILPYITTNSVKGEV